MSIDSDWFEEKTMMESVKVIAVGWVAMGKETITVVKAISVDKRVTFTNKEASSVGKKGDQSKKQNTKID